MSDQNDAYVMIEEEEDAAVVETDVLDEMVVDMYEVRWVWPPRRFACFVLESEE